MRPRLIWLADKAQIAKNIAVWKQLGKTGETEKILTYFANDVMIFPAGQPVIKGWMPSDESSRTALVRGAQQPGDIRVWMARSSRIVWMKAGTIVRTRLCCALRST